MLTRNNYVSFHDPRLSPQIKVAVAEGGAAAPRGKLITAGQDGINLLLWRMSCRTVSMSWRIFAVDALHGSCGARASTPSGSATATAQRSVRSDLIRSYCTACVTCDWHKPVIAKGEET
jgi:hypothetical protein